MRFWLISRKKPELFPPVTVMFAPLLCTGMPPPRVPPAPLCFLTQNSVLENKKEF